MSAPKMTWADFSARYCKTQVSTPDEMVNANNMWIGIEKDGYAHS